MNEKEALEEYAVQNFIEALREQTGISYKIIEHRDRPDLVIENEDTGERLGVEVTHLFYDSQEARIILGRAKEDFHEVEQIDLYIERLNKLLAQKAEKANGYDYKYNNILLVRVVSPVFDINDFDALSDKIKVPDCCYVNIWLLFYDFDHNYWGILKLLK